MYPEIEQLNKIDEAKAHGFIQLALADFSKRLMNSKENEFNRFAELDPLRELANKYLAWFDQHLMNAIEERDNEFKEEYRSILRDHFSLSTILDLPAHASIPEGVEEDEPDWDAIEREVIKEVETGE